MTAGRHASSSVAGAAARSTTSTHPPRPPEYVRRRHWRRPLRPRPGWPPHRGPLPGSSTPRRRRSPRRCGSGAARTDRSPRCHPPHRPRAPPAAAPARDRRERRPRSRLDPPRAHRRRGAGVGRRPARPRSSGRQPGERQSVAASAEAEPEGSCSGPTGVAITDPRRRGLALRGSPDGVTRPSTSSVEPPVPSGAPARAAARSAIVAAGWWRVSSTSTSVAEHGERHPAAVRTTTSTVEGCARRCE